MGFVRRQQERLARHFLVRRLEKLGRPLPEEDVLRREARRLVDDAGRIASQTGRNLLSILQDLVRDLRR